MGMISQVYEQLLEVFFAKTNEIGVSSPSCQAWRKNSSGQWKFRGDSSKSDSEMAFFADDKETLIGQ